MGPTIRELGIDQLTNNQKIDLAIEIWDSLDRRPVSGPVDRDLHRELVRRGAELDAKPEMGLSWEDIKSSLVEPE